MAAQQYIFKVRRNYNQWVNNQTLEDYALRFTAKSSRRWSLGRVANTALGAISFLALEAIGAAITMSYGFDNAAVAICVVGAIIFFAGLPICYYAAKYGVDIDLLTRGAGFGYIGSTATSLIYASFTFIFFALEAAIMAKALELLLGIPMAWGYIFSSIVVIPLVFYGITFISRFQLWTQPLWVGLQLLPFIFILFNNVNLLEDWRRYEGTKQGSSGVDILLFGAAASVMFALVAQIGEQVDFLRFLPPKENNNRFRWWCSLVLAGPGWVIVGMLKIFIGSFLAVVAVEYGQSIYSSTDPTIMYSVAFRFVTENEHLALILAGIFVVISQLKINVTNAYAGSIAWSNFFSRLTHNHPGRVVWLVFNVAIALLLMELGIYHAFESTLSIYAIVAVSWVGALVADLVINKPLGLSPKHIEFKRAHLYDVNPVGVGAMFLASCFGVIAYMGFWGEIAQALAHFIALTCTFILSPAIAKMTKGKYYIARTPYVFSDKSQSLECTICQNHYEHEDMAHCPAYDGYICSLCCSLDARCQDLCKSESSRESPFLVFIYRYFPAFIAKHIDLRFIHFVGLLATVAVVGGILLGSIYTNISTNDDYINQLLEATLWKVFFILMIVAGVICWLFVLARQSQIVSQEESRTQTRRLVEEIEAHEKTDLQLQIAKEQAEAANNAKSRYLTGISHELRSPLNSVLGYAQLIEADKAVDNKTRERISVVKRSADHLADLIEGLLDISKIEAGRLDIQKESIRFKELLKDIERMFRIQAEEKGLYFSCEWLSPLPEVVMGDKKRLRQILINLLSNAVKFTNQGYVKFLVSYRNQVAEFRVIDSGIGVDESEMERIFKPFERVRKPGAPLVPGTGLGLTITRLLTEIMGGELVLENNPDGGCVFTVSLMLSHVFLPDNKPIESKKIVGYHGDSKTIMLVDDDATHRGIISDLLLPLNFKVVEAQDAESCLDMVNGFSPDIFLIDRQMPGMNGPDLAVKLRQIGFNIPILMVTANANSDSYNDVKSSATFTRIDEEAYDDYILKPIRLNDMLKRIGHYLKLRWIYEEELENDTSLLGRASIDGSVIYLPKYDHVKEYYDDLLYYAEIGNLSKLKLTVKTMHEDPDADQQFVDQLKDCVSKLHFNRIISILTKIRREAGH